MKTKRMRVNAPVAALLMILAVLALPGAARAQTPWSTPDASNNIHSTNTGNVGVGTSSPGQTLEAYANNSGEGYQAPGLTIQQAGTGDATLSFLLTGVRRFQMGVDNSDSDKFKIFSDNGGNFTGSGITIDTAGNVGVGTASPASLFHVANSSGLGSMRLSGSGASVMSFIDTAAPANQRQYQWRSEGGAFRMSLVNDSDGGFLKQNILVANSSGNVGIGTGSPDTAKLVIAGTAGSPGVDLASSDVYAELRVIRNSVGAADKDLYLQYQAGAGSKTHIYSNNAETVTVSGGKVGIGNNNPSTALDVTGAINATGAITGATVNATYQDVAEWVPSTQKLSAGTVVVLDTGRTNYVLASTKAYDTRVAGVVSAEPGVILGVAGDGKLKVATTGRVRVKADATRGAIKVGDLLVTSDVEGLAMKSVEVDLGGVKIHRPGTIIGKALEPLASGTGEVLVLLSLQ